MADMTEEERDAKIEDIHSALFDVPVGSPEGTNPLITDIREIATNYHRGKWALRAAIWGLPALAGIGIAWEKIAQLWSKATT